MLDVGRAVASLQQQIAFALQAVVDFGAVGFGVIMAFGHVVFVTDFAGVNDSRAKAKLTLDAGAVVAVMDFINQRVALDNGGFGIGIREPAAHIRQAARRDFVNTGDAPCSKVNDAAEGLDVFGHGSKLLSYSAKMSATASDSPGSTSPPSSISPISNLRIESAVYTTTVFVAG